MSPQPRSHAIALVTVPFHLVRLQTTLATLVSRTKQYRPWMRGHARAHAARRRSWSAAFKWPRLISRGIAMCDEVSTARHTCFNVAAAISRGMAATSLPPRWNMRSFNVAAAKQPRNHSHGPVRSCRIPVSSMWPRLRAAECDTTIKNCYIYNALQCGRG